MLLEPATCYHALRTRDARFDGRFFVAVATTSIYCRPVCVARTPARANCTFYRLAAEAERAGFRACLRCRPELAPGAAPIDALPRLVTRAVQRIEAGALSSQSLAALATELGVTDRHLRRALADELGVAPIELAQSRRLALAKQLVSDGRLPMTEIAFASGFRSVRRFNAAFAERFQRTPSQLRKQAEPAARSATFGISLGFREPLSWPQMLQFFGARTLPHVELIDDVAYVRTLRVGDRTGYLRVTRPSDKPLLRVEMSDSLSRAVMPIASAARRAFDLDADPAAIAQQLGRDRALAAKLSTWSPRLPSGFDGFEIAVRAVVGQQVSVAAARTLHGRIVERFGDAIDTPFPALTHVHPTAERLAALSPDVLATIGLPKQRATTLHRLAIAVWKREVVLEPGVDPERLEQQLLALPGIGPWTAQYVLMRGLATPDAFPDGDLGLLRAFDGTSRKALLERAEAWRPWRAYAAIAIWTALGGG